MNKITKFLFLGAAALSAVSCLEEVEPTAYVSEGKLTEIATEDPGKTFSAAVAGLYNDFQQYVHTDMSHNYFGQKSFDYLTSLMGNDMVMTGLFAMSWYHYILDYRGQNYVATSNRWREYYRVIDNANNILKLIDPETATSDIKSYQAIALGFRGYAYLQLTYLYQHSYYVGAEGTKWGKGQKYDFSQEPCVPLLTENTDGDQPRSTVEQVYDQLLSDLEESYRIFEEIGQVKTSSPTDFDGCVAAMYLARAYMVKQDWDNAIKYAQVVIDNYPVLTTEDQILQGFSDINLPDIVFGCDITADNSTVYMSWFSQMDAYGAGYGAIGVYRAGFKPFVDKINDNDIRLQWFCCERSTGQSGTVMLRDTEYPASVDYQSVKFIGAGRETVRAGYDPSTGATGWELGDYIYLRSEEAWLIKAEALAHKGDASAVTVLNEFMRTRQPDYNWTATDKASLIEEINFQKRVEFWGEGIEYLDNRRLNIPVDRTDETWGSDNNHYDGAKFKYEQEDKQMVYQLPISEIENNKVLTSADQNP